MGSASELPVLIGIDVGTQSIRAIAFDAAGRKIVAGQRPTPAIVTDGGGAEYDPDAIFATVVAVLAEVGHALAGRPVAGLAVDSVGESCVLVGADGRALGPVDRMVRSPHRSGRARDRRRQSGLRASSRSPATPSIRSTRSASSPGCGGTGRSEVAATRNVLLMADWVAYRLSGELATDPTLASRTLYFDLHKGRWSQEMLDFVHLDTAVLPPIMASGTALGPVRREILAETGIAGAPVVGVGGHDHLVGSYAAGVVRPGLVLDSLGTAEAIVFAAAAPITDPEIIRRRYFQGAMGRGDAYYLGAGINSSGGSVEWLRRVVGGPSNADLIAEAASVPAGSGGVLFVPHFGNSPPEPEDHPRGAFLGLTASASRGVLYRAVLEGLALQARHVLDGMGRLAGVTRPEEIRVIGGGSRNDLFLRIKANAFARRLIVIDEAEASALGAALLGGIAAGLWPDLPQAHRALARPEHVVEPDADAARYEEILLGAFLPASEAVRSVNRRLSEVERAGDEDYGAAHAAMLTS